MGGGLGNAVLFSIGQAFRKAGSANVRAALAYYETERREEVEKTQHSADVSLVWFEHVKRFWDMDPTRFAFGLMTRSKAITYDNLALRAPEFVRLADKLVARDAQAQGFDVDLCRGLAVAIFNDASKVRFVPLSSATRFMARTARRSSSRRVMPAISLGLGGLAEALIVDFEGAFAPRGVMSPSMPAAPAAQ